MAGVIPREIADAITDCCRGCESTDAVRIADRLMELEEVRMHGPEHHYLTAAAILTAYCNFHHMEKKSILVKAYVRTNIIPAGVCAMYGCCGALMGAGAAAGILLFALPLPAVKEQILLQCQIVIGRRIPALNISQLFHHTGLPIRVPYPGTKNSHFFPMHPLFPG